MLTDDTPALRSSIGATATGENHEDNLRASSVRLALGTFSVVALPYLVPGLAQFRWVLAAYVVGGVAFHVAIQKNVGGVIRVLLGGVMDVAFITFLVQRLGSQTTPLVSSYLLSAMFNALVAPAWSARTVGGLAVAAYAGVSYAEALGYLAYAPSLPEFASFSPSVEASTRSVTVVATLVFVSTWVSDRIARALRVREAQLREVNGQLQHLSQRDPLTQLYNRRYFVQRLQEELARVRRGHSMTVLMMDLDGFKHINDQQGHLAGDELLKKIARAIEETTREIDVVGRFGGDEFVALLSDTDADQAVVVAERLVRTVRAAGTEADTRRPVTASIGLAIAQPEDDVGVILSAADEAAYLAKQAGGNRHHTSMPARSRTSLTDSALKDSGTHELGETG